MENINSTTLTISTIMFITLTFLAYLILYNKAKKFFSWKRNLLIITIGFAIVLGVSFLADLSNNMDIVLGCGIIVASPVIAYTLVATRVFLEKNKNKKVIKTKDNYDKKHNF